MAGILLISADGSLDGAYHQALGGRAHTVACVRTAAEGIRAMLTLGVDAVLLDTRIGAGVDEFRRWLLADPVRARVPLLYLVPPNVVGDRPAGFRAGVDGWLARPFSAGALAEAVAALLRGSGDTARPDVMVAGQLSFDVRRRLATLGGQSTRLTPIEGRLLAYLMERPGLPVGAEELLVRVWGYYPGTGGPEVVRAHVRNLRRKLEALAPGREAILTVPRLGYRFVAEAAAAP